MAKAKQPQAKKPPAKKQNPPTVMFPSLHDDVLTALADTPITPTPWFNNLDDDEAPIKSYSTYIMGRFSCYKRACPNRAWSSKKVCIVIRRYAPGNGYNAVVYKQRCKGCDKLGKMRIDENSYVERVAFRLKRWAGVYVEEPGFGRRKGPEHEFEFCEGCKAGVCGAGEL